MAKRFTDTEKWMRPWFRKLSLEAKMTWVYLLDNCDHAGVWPADFEILNFLIGKSEATGACGRADAEWLDRTFGDKIQRIDEDKYFIPSFVEFQYGELNPNNNAHASVLKLLGKLGANEPLPSPSPGAQDKDKDKDKDLEKEKEKENSARANFAPQPAPTPTNPLTPDSIRELKEIWIESKRVLGAANLRITAQEERLIAQSVRQNGVEDTRLALLGARWEPSNEKFDPKAHVDLFRVLMPDKDGRPRIQKFAEYGAKGMQRAQAESAKREQRDQVLEDEPVPPPEEVRKLLAGFGIGRMPK